MTYRIAPVTLAMLAAILAGPAGVVIDNAAAQETESLEVFKQLVAPMPAVEASEPMGIASSRQRLRVQRKVITADPDRRAAELAAQEAAALEEARQLMAQRQAVRAASRLTPATTLRSDSTVRTSSRRVSTINDMLRQQQSVAAPEPLVDRAPAPGVRRPVPRSVRRVDFQEQWGVAYPVPARTLTIPRAASTMDVPMTQAVQDIQDVVTGPAISSAEPVYEEIVTGEPLWEEGAGMSSVLVDESASWGAMPVAASGHGAGQCGCDSCLNYEQWMTQRLRNWDRCEPYWRRWWRDCQRTHSFMWGKPGCNNGRTTGGCASCAKGHGNCQHCGHCGSHCQCGY